MSNLIILPIILPLLTGIALIFFHKRLSTVRLVTKVMVLVNFAVALYAGVIVFRQGSIVLETGDWVAPYGIILVADPLSITLVIVADLIAVASAFYAFRSLDEEREKFYFYSFFFILITGVSGAFLTGDLFNLFVFFEVLLMASYGMIVLGGTKKQLRESLKYVLINLFSSMVFVTAVAFLYSVTGTVNMAQLATRVAEAEQSGILTTIGIVLFFVFATKGALFPLYFWLPRSYEAPPAVISALFGALLTKVGVYSILRVFTLIFVHQLSYTHSLFIILAGFTMLFGVTAALSTNNVKLVIAYNIIPAIGYMMMGIGIFSALGIAGTVYYLVHDMIVKAALFFIVGAMIAIAGTSDLRKMGGLIHHHPLLGWMFLIASLVLAGLPPFSGFVGKIVLLKAAIDEGHYVIFAIALVTSLLILLSVLRIFVQAFWGKENLSVRDKKGSDKGVLFPTALLIAFSIFLGIGAEVFYPFAEQIANHLINPDSYVHTVLKE